MPRLAYQQFVGPRAPDSKATRFRLFDGDLTPTWLTRKHTGIRWLATSAQVRDCVPSLRTLVQHGYSIDLIPYASPEMLAIVIRQGKLRWEVQNSDLLGFPVEDLDTMTALLRRSFGVGPRRTPASTALACWQTTLKERHWRVHPETEEQIRLAYFGGYTPLLSRDLHADVVHYDIHAAYPAQMLRGVPCGRAYQVRHFDAAHPGIYRVQVQTPPQEDCRLPILPYRHKGFVCYPYGRFFTSCTSEEILYARQQGYTVEVLDGVVWLDEQPVFTTFLQQCQALEHATAGSQRRYLKLLRNSLYGKFATRRERVRYLLSPDWPGPAWSEYDPAAARTDPDSLIADLYEQQSIGESGCMLPHWSIFITARARLHLHATMQAIGWESVLYADTDSVIVHADADVTCLDVGDAYGQWRAVEHYRHFRAFDPKYYVYEQQDGGIGMKCIGVDTSTLTEDDRVLALAGVRQFSWRGDVQSSVPAMLAGHASREALSKTFLDASPQWEGAHAVYSLSV